MDVHPFGKADSCCFLWVLKKTATDSITNIIVLAKEHFNAVSTLARTKVKPWKYQSNV